MPFMLPLKGVKVVEIAQNLAGPFCGQILGTLGADVVKIERPEGGDDCRGWGPPFPDGMGTAFQVLNPNKRSVTLDVKNAADLKWLEDFIGENDILVHNMRPGVMTSLGLDGPTLRKKFPKLIYAEISGFGATGPLRNRPGYDAVVQALSGLFHLNGDPQSPPSRLGPSVLDYGSGMWTVIGCLAALRARDQSGEGSIVDTSLFETALSFVGPSIATVSMTGSAPPRQRAGIAKVVLFEAFKTADSEVIFAAANDRLFVKLVNAVGRSDLAKDPKFKTNADRVKHRDELMVLFEALMKTKTSAEWLSALEANGVPCSEINKLEQTVKHPQTAAVDMIEEVKSTGLSLTRIPLRFDGKRPGIVRRAPKLGEHTSEVRRAREKN